MEKVTIIKQILFLVKKQAKADNELFDFFKEQLAKAVTKQFSGVNDERLNELIYKMSALGSSSK